MNQEKIGKYILNCRKKKNLTQEELAEKLKVSNKSVSRWENGKTMPDVSLFKPLCEILDISLEELLSGEEKNTQNKSTIEYINYQKRLYRFKNVMIILACLTAFLLLSFIIFKKPKLECTEPLDYYKTITTINDATTLYSKFNKNNYGKFFKKTLENISLNQSKVQNILSNFNLIDASNDGGSLYYQSKDKKIYIALCNSLEANGGNKNIYISDKEDLKICTYDFEVSFYPSCVMDKLNPLIDAKWTSPRIPVDEITKGNIPHYDIITTEKGFYAIIKTNEEQVVTDFKNYFHAKSDNFIYTNIFENWYVFFSNGDSINKEELNECVY